MNVFRTERVGDDWPAVRAELERLFILSQAAAQAEESIVYVVHNDDLLGRRGAGDAMVATGILSAARTAAIEGARKGWCANVIAHDDDVPSEEVERWALSMLDSHGVTGEVVHIGVGHVGKALP